MTIYYCRLLHGNKTCFHDEGRILVVKDLY